MKCVFFITFLFSFLIAGAGMAEERFESFNPQVIPGMQSRPLDQAVLDARKNQIFDMLKEAEKQSRKKAEYLFEDKSTRVAGCGHCPRYFALTDSVNKVLEELKKNPDVAKDEEVPLSINRLRFLFYVVQSRDADGKTKCERFNDVTVDLQPTKFDGEMQLVAEDIFKFDGITQVQILEPGTDEVIYYYRGEGSQKNVIIQAILNKDGGKFRYYYLHEEEKNLYNLPILSDADLTPKERRARQRAAEIKAKEDALLNPPPISEAPPTGPVSKDKLEWALEPKLELRNRFIPKDYHLARGAVSQGVLETGLRVNATSSLSVRGNKANLSLQNEEGKSYVEVALDTSITGKTEHRVVIPYEVRLGAKNDQDTFEVKGQIEEMTTTQTISLSLTDKYTQYFRTEYRKDKNTNLSTLSVAKDFTLGPKEAVTVAVGKSETKTKYASLQHRKSLRDNITMVLDVRVDENRQASFQYQLNAKF